MKLERYTVHESDGGGLAQRPDSNGEWVKASDVECLLSSLPEAVPNNGGHLDEGCKQHGCQSLVTYAAGHLVGLYEAEEVCRKRSEKKGTDDEGQDEAELCRALIRDLRLCLSMNPLRKDA